MQGIKDFARRRPVYSSTEQSTVLSRGKQRKHFNNYLTKRHTGSYPIKIHVVKIEVFSIKAFLSF